jgi:hypothetical protein
MDLEKIEHCSNMSAATIAGYSGVGNRTLSRMLEPLLQSELKRGGVDIVSMASATGRGKGAGGQSGEVDRKLF